MGHALVDINQIIPNPNNPRKNFDEESLRELADSIREHGILQPLLVRYAGLGEDGNLQCRLICGERRLRAAMMLRMEKVPVVYKVADEDELSPAAEALKMLVENLQREDLDPIDEAAAYQRVLDEFGYTQEDLAQQVGKSQSHIANRLRLLELPDTVRENISRGIISASHGKVLAGHKNIPAEMMEAAVKTIVEQNVPVAKTEDLIKRSVANNGKPLFDHWNTNLKPQFKSGKGSACYECEHRAMGASWGNEQEQPYCLNHECWEAKQEEALQKKLEKAQKAGGDENTVDIGKLNWNQYEYWSKGATDYDQSECHDCEHRKRDKGSDRYYCLDPACMRKKRAAKTKADNAKKKTAFEAELGQIAEMAKSHVDTLFYHGKGVAPLDRPALIYIAAQVLANVRPWHDRKITLFQYLRGKFGWEHDVLKREAWGQLGDEWDAFRSLLEKLDELQLLEVIFEWPAVARGLKGAEGWFLRQVPQSAPELEPQTSPEPKEEPEEKLPPGISSRVGWILRNSAGDSNYISAIPKLTDEELLYCIQKETRKSGLQRLKAEARRRGPQPVVDGDGQCSQPRTV